MLIPFNHPNEKREEREEREGKQMIPLSLHPETTSHPNAILDAFPLSIKRDILTPALANNSKK